MAIRRLASGLFVAYFRQGGRRVERSLMTHDRAEAERRHGALMAVRSLQRFAARNGLQAVAGDLPAPHRLLISDALKVASKRKTFAADAVRIWNRFAAECGARYMDEVTPQAALAYLEGRCPGGNGKTYNNIKSVLNSVFRLTLVESRLTASPFASVATRQLGEVEHHRNLTDAELAAVMARVPPAIQAAAMLSRWTTQRLETVCRMTPAQFDWAKGAFIIMPGKTRRFGKFVVCPILPALEAYLRPLVADMEQERPIVAQLAGDSQYKPGYISKVFCAALTAAGIVSGPAGKVGFHSIRGTAVTWFKEHGFISDVLRRITGHATPAMEDLYARDVAPVLAAAAALKNKQKSPAGAGLQKIRSNFIFA